MANPTNINKNSKYKLMIKLNPNIISIFTYIE